VILPEHNRQRVLSALQAFRAAGASITQVAANLNMLPALVAQYIAELVADSKAFDVSAQGSPVKRFRAIRREAQL
jgi:hypothetical protein